MKTRNIFSIAAALSVLLLSSCNTFLDKIPDQRTEVNSADKIAKLLVSAYSTATPQMIHDFMSDNNTDIGAQNGVVSDLQLEAYFFDEKITTTAWDSPFEIWKDNYRAIAAANLALDGVREVEAGGGELPAHKAEALLCRAYAHFTLVNAFCQAYNTESSNTDLGIPYMEVVETTPINYYERGTVAEVYKKIYDDIEEALPLVDDGIFAQPKYHLNRRAAHAFAAQFNLYYGNYDKAAEYASIALGENPSSLFRNWALYQGVTAPDEVTALFIKSEENANFFLQGLSSIHGRCIGKIASYSRISQAPALTPEFMGSSGTGPWTGNLRSYTHSFGSSTNYFPKRQEYFVYTDVAEGTGSLWNMLVQFSVEKTLIDRAEAYVMLGEYELAAQDLSNFYLSYGATSGSDLAGINSFYASGNSRYVKDINPRFEIQSGMQTNLIHAVLHARRIATMHEGGRLPDIKRFGMKYTHYVDNAADIVIEPFDKRLAIQIPDLVISAGIQKNPR